MTLWTILVITFSDGMTGEVAYRSLAECRASMLVVVPALVERGQQIDSAECRETDQISGSPRPRPRPEVF